MGYPTPSEYQEALQHPADAFADEELRTAQPRTGPLGLPRPTTGAFSAVFPMTTREGVTYAAKCFLSAVEDQQARYRAVADHLAEEDLGCTIGFDYQPGGVRVQGEAYPLLKMEWAEGTPLNQYMAAHLDEPGTLATLAEAWTALLAALDEAGMAHGDLQHGNVLVEEGPDLTLVDYDTFFVPALAGYESAEVGHRNYQHPDRAEGDFGPHLDCFSGLAVYVALRALVLRPELWEEYDTGENVLFRAADFYDPDASPLFAELREIDEVEREVEALRAACHLPLEETPSLQEAQRGAAPRSLGSSRRGRRRPAPSRKGLARGFAPALGGGSVAVCALALAGHPGAALLVLVLIGAAGGGLAVRGYRRQAVVRRGRRLRQEEARVRERIENLRREERTLQRQREDVVGRAEERRAEHLAALREEALRDRLKHHFIGEVRALEGLTHKTVVRLKAAGIRTAYEASPEALAEVRRLSDRSRERLHGWRAALVEQYAEEVPKELSPAQERRLQRFTERRLEQIDAEVARVRRKRAAQEVERADLRARAEALPKLSFGAYLRYLLRFRSTLPRPEEPPVPAQTAPPGAEEDSRGAVLTPVEEHAQAWYEGQG